MKQGHLSEFLDLLLQDASDEEVAHTSPKRKRRRAHKGFTNNRRTRQLRGKGRR